MRIDIINGIKILLDKKRESYIGAMIEQINQSVSWLMPESLLQYVSFFFSLLAGVMLHYERINEIWHKSVSKWPTFKCQLVVTTGGSILVLFVPIVYVAGYFDEVCRCCLHLVIGYTAPKILKSIPATHKVVGYIMNR